MREAGLALLRKMRGKEWDSQGRMAGGKAGEGGLESWRIGMAEFEVAFAKVRPSVRRKLKRGGLEEGGAMEAAGGGGGVPEG